jgi:hypothetical protein
VNHNVENGPLQVEGMTYQKGLGMNARCTLVYDLPAGHSFKTFRALCGYDSSCDRDNTSASGTTMEFIISVVKEEPYAFDLTTLGYAPDESVPVYDIWQKADLETATGSITLSVPSHGVRLLRLGDNKADGIGAVSLPDEGATSASLHAGNNTGVFDLTGRQVRCCTSSSPLASNPMHKGLYIVNGNKVVVR